MNHSDRAFIVGGGNSAAQAAMNLSRYVEKVTMVVRGDSLKKSISQYLVDRIRSSANDQRLTTVSKERLQHFRAATGKHSAANLDLVVQLRVVQNLHHGGDCACLRVVRTIYQALDAGMHHRAGAHGARFDCNQQFAVFQTVVSDGGSSFAQGHDFGVGGWIGIGDIAIPSAADNAAIAHDDRTHGNLSRLKRALGAAESFLHPEFVGGGLGAGFYRRGVACGCFVTGQVEAPPLF
jgi:hypothetical protein